MISAPIPDGRNRLFAHSRALHDRRHPPRAEQVAYGIAVSFGDLTETLTVSQISWWNIPLTLTQSGLYALLVALAARRMCLQTSTRPPLEEPRPASAPVTV